MAKLSLSQSPKFKLLVRALDLPVPYVRGYLELLWESTHFRDDPCFESFDEIEAICEWQGEDGILAQTLLDRQWIDQENDCYVIHGYEEHLPYYVKERRRQAVYRANQNKSSQDNTDLSRDSHVTIPDKKHQEKRREEKRREEKCNKEEYSAAFKTFWEEYPVKKSKSEALRIWVRDNLDENIDIIIEALKAQKKNRNDIIQAKQWVAEWKHPSTWLNQKCWEDEIETPSKFIDDEEELDYYYNPLVK